MPNHLRFFTFRGLLNVLLFFRDAFREWHKDHPPLLAAGLGYFAVISLVPFLVILLAVTGQVWAHAVTKSEFIERFGNLMGTEVATTTSRWLWAATSRGKGQATLLSAVVLLVGASRVFLQLRTALDLIWDVEPREESLMRSMARTTMMSVVMILIVCAFLLTFTSVDALITYLQRYFGQYIPGLGHLPVLRAFNLVIPLILFTLLFASAYKWVPQTPIRWSDVWPGAIVASVFFAIGKALIGLYLAFQSFRSIYGAATSIIVILVWVYFAAHIFFFGAEFCWLYANRYGSRSRPGTAPPL